MCSAIFGRCSTRWRKARLCSITWTISNTGDGPNENFAREFFELHAWARRTIRACADETRASGRRQPPAAMSTPMSTARRPVSPAGASMRIQAASSSTNRPTSPIPKLSWALCCPNSRGKKDGKDVLDLLAYHPAPWRVTSVAASVAV